VFHVTDQLGSKLTDDSLILYIQQVSLSVHIRMPIHTRTSIRIAVLVMYRYLPECFLSCFSYGYGCSTFM
jgi:hypothetical protein